MVPSVSEQAVFLILCLATLALGQQDDVLAIECPVPGSTGAVGDAECSSYSACVFTDGVCHMQDNAVAGYRYAAEFTATPLGYTIPLEKNDPSATLFEADIAALTLEVSYYEDYHVRMKIFDPANDRYEVPLPLNIPTESSPNPLADVTVGQEGDDVILNVTRRSTGAELFSTIGPITFEDQFIQFTVRLASHYLYGFGENPHDNLQHSFNSRTTYPMFARDQSVERGETNHYGVFPYYVNIEDNEGNTHSVLFYNSNAMEYSLFELSDGTAALTIRSIGGIIDIHVFAGPTPEDVNRQYATLVGEPAFPPYWALGFHLSRYGYANTDEVRKVRRRMKLAGIPQDVQTFDIDYMDGFKDFTYDPVNFGDLPELVEELHADNIRTTLILDPYVAINTSYSTFTNGKTANAFITWLTDDLVPDDQPLEADQYVVGYGWPAEKTVFPDFFKPETKEWWASEIDAFKQQVNFDAIWIDMNEPSNFGTNLDQPWNWPDDEESWSLKCPDHELNSPPYPTKAATQNVSESQTLSDKTICMSSAQTDGTNTFTHYDVHSLYGYSQSAATFEAMEALNESSRPVVLSRSTFPGSGQYAVHWLGDNYATWEGLRDSIIGMIEFNLFGIPMVGADICGFIGNTTEELCARWMQLGAFYPFSRNHNDIGSEDQDPTVWPQVAEISKNVLLLRYKYLPYLYSLFHNAHMRGNSVIRPLFNVFPSDVSVRNNADQFFWGDAIMVAPVLYENTVSRDVYFPEGTWYDLESGVQVSTGSMTQQVSAPLEKIPVYVRGGRIVPFQEPSVTTHQSRLNDFGLLVALDDTLFASGEVFWDDGTTDHAMSETFLSDVVFYEDQLVMTQNFNEDAADGVNLGTIKIVGFPNVPVVISINGINFHNFDYTAATQILEMTVNMPLKNDFMILINYPDSLT